MLNFLWAGMILIGIVYGVFTGNMEAVTAGALQSAQDAISLCITMAGVISLWMGLMEIAKEAGLIAKCTRGISPFLNFLFPKIPGDHPAREYIATNLIANILGLGWACTPAGLKAMEALAGLQREREEKEDTEKMCKKDAGKEEDIIVASDEMCDFLILNISSLQLIPVNMIAYRSQYHSNNPTSIIAPAIVATCISTLIAVVYIKLRHSVAPITKRVMQKSDWAGGRK